MKLIVGLGNPGDQYKNTLHNVGFDVLEELAKDIGIFQWQQKFKGEFLQARVGSDAFVLLKPLTYMNISGESVQACKQFFKLELEDILVVSDDIDRPAGSIRYRVSGGHGGHNGLRSIIQQCGGNTFHRLKIGIGRPISGDNVAKHVLSKPSAESKIAIEAAIKQTTDYLVDFIKGITIQVKPAES